MLTKAARTVALMPAEPVATAGPSRRWDPAEDYMSISVSAAG